MLDGAVNLRQSRKLDHIKYCLQSEDGPGTTGFEDINLVHNCLPDLALSKIDTRTSVAGLQLSSPIILNAITGGAHDVTELNRKLAFVARTCEIPMAVGSQTAAIEDPAVRESFMVVRRENPAGIVIANIGANISHEGVLKAVEMIKADALQIHLNAAQELAMPEGDRDFCGYAANIKQIVSSLSIPVIVKEVGFGMAWEQVQQLFSLGVSAIDIGGRGGTNFAVIESAREPEQEYTFLNRWGIPTACSLLEAAAQPGFDADIITSGGIRSAEDIVKALALGAKAAGIAAPCLQMLHNSGAEALIKYIQRLQYELRCIMLLTGAASIQELQTKPVVVTGATSQWLEARGIDFSQFARRK